MKYLIAVAAYLLFSTPAFAQVEVYDPYIPVKSGKTSSLGHTAPSFAITFNPVILSRGMFGPYTELGIHKIVTINAGIGITAKDFLYEIYSRVFDQGNTYSVSKNFAMMESDNRTSLPGFFCEGGIKLYPSGHDRLEGFYLAPNLRYRAYKSYATFYETSSGLSPSYSTGKETQISLNYSMLEPNLKLGWQFESYFYDGLTIDMYVGGAYSILSRNGYTEDRDDNTYELMITPVKETKYRPLLMWGVAIGHVF